MTFLPIVAREMRVAARKRSTYLGRAGAAFVPIVIAGFWLPVFAAQFNISAGKLLFTVLSSLAFAYCLLAGVSATSDCLSAEKREGTIGLLFLTDLRGYDIVFGKLASRSLTAFYGLLAAVPVLSLSLLLGGVTLVEVGQTALLLLNTLFFSMAAGVFASALSRHERRAMFATACVILLTVFAPYAFALLYALWQWKQTGVGPPGFDDLPGVVQFSPVFAFRILRASVMTPGIFARFYTSILATHLLSWTLLIIASWIVPRVCRERVPGRWGTRWLLLKNRWTYGNPERRKTFRTRLLNRNPFAWLAARDRVKAHYVWFFIGAIFLIWTWSGWMLGRAWLDWDFSIILLWFCFVFLKVWLTSEVCARLVEDQASGAFELLLSTPLTIQDVARGQSMALLRQFGRPVLALGALTLLLFWRALNSSHTGNSNAEITLLFGTLLIMLAADMVTLKWLGTWHAVTSNQVNRASLAAAARVLLLPAVLFVVFYSLYRLAEAAMGVGPQTQLMWQACAFWLVIGLANDLFWGVRARWQFLHHFRDVVAQRYSGKAPRFAPFAELISAITRRMGRKPDKARQHVPFWRRWWITAPAALLVCGVIGAAIWKRSIHQRVETKLEEIRERGEPTTPAEFKSWRPAVLQDENAAIPFERAAQLISRAQFPRSSKGKQVVWPGATEPLPLETRLAVSNFVAGNQLVLQSLRAGAKLKKSQYPIEWDYAPATVAPWQAFSKVGLATEVLEFQALHSIEEGDRSGAIEAIRTLLALGWAMGQEPCLAAQTYRLRFLNSASRVLERTLNRHVLPGQELTALQQEFREAEIATGVALTRGFIGERSLQIQEVRSPSNLWSAPPNGWWRALMELTLFAAEVLEVPNRLLLEHLELYDEFIERAQGVGPAVAELAAAGAVYRETPSARNPNKERLVALRAYWEQTLEAQIKMVARLRAAQTALAVERFRGAAEGRAPRFVEELIPNFMSERPDDPFLRGPLRFRQLNPGYLIYSVGPDRNDNDGFDPAHSGASANSRGESDIAVRVLR